MVTDLLLPQLAFRALSDDPEGDEDNLDTSPADQELEDKNEAEDGEDLAEAGFGVEESPEETTE